MSLDFVGATRTKVLVSWWGPPRTHRILFRASNESQYTLHEDNVDRSYSLLCGLVPGRSYEVVVETASRDLAEKTQRASLTVRTGTSSASALHVGDALMVCFWDDDDQKGYFDVFLDALRVAQTDKPGLCKVFERGTASTLEIYFGGSAMHRVPAQRTRQDFTYRFLRRGCVYDMRRFADPCERLVSMAPYLCHGDTIRITDFYTYIDRSDNVPGDRFVLPRVGSWVLNSTEVTATDDAVTGDVVVANKASALWFVVVAGDRFSKSTFFKTKCVSMPTVVHRSLEAVTHSGVVSGVEVSREASGSFGYCKYVRDGVSLKRVVTLSKDEMDVMSTVLSKDGLRCKSFLGIGTGDSTLALTCDGSLRVTLGNEGLCKFS